MENPSSSNPKATNLWDCGSTLYDSFELNSFKRHLDSAIANSARSLSMPHLSDRRLPEQPPPPPPPSTVSKKPFKISRSLHKFLRSVFKLNNHHHQHHNNLHKSSSLNSASSTFEVPQKSRDRYVVVYDKSGPVLSAIPEQPEFEMAKVSPDISSLVKRSASERFTPRTIGISRA
ncbi:hypothetical protein QN277_028371 [Acacia crassicarpa]|uniref:Uncharacterized protein n=1 Tax=Acacia crassicarpa TaxID=499986 RepID=A0AAE1J2Z5_9FABA|nr:hypothetical protein QN277_028371 [Acacia crassicarpa]